MGNAWLYASARAVRSGWEMTDLQFDLGGGAEARPVRPDDADELFALIDAERERLSAWLPWVVSIRSVEDERAWVKAVLEGNQPVPPLVITAEGRVVGGIAIEVGPFGVAGEIGYWIAKEFEGRGLVTAASRALIDHAFRQLGVHRIVISAASANLRSRTIPERLGFTREGVLREAGKGRHGFHDLVVYGLLDRGWAG
jgi:ribosomal-protein-serine acetyltransferase